jgi:Ca2+-binding EF-hand superfamily protein
MRAALRARGAVGIRGLARNFQICDTDGSRKLDHDELRKCLRLCKIDLQPHEFEALFTHADSDGSGLVDYEEFLRVVRGRMAPLRRKLVVSIFNGIDQRARSNGHGARDGVITVDDLRDFYSAKEHPDVKAGKRTESAVLQELLDGFEGKKGNRDGSVSLEEWVGYCTASAPAKRRTRQTPHPPNADARGAWLACARGARCADEETSASIDNDEHFNTTMISAWPMLFDPKQAGEAALPMPVPLAKIDAIEKMLIDAIRARSSGSNETRALETAFKSFDTDKNGTIEFSEFRKAMERFGLATGGHASVSGCTLDVINALFDRYDPDGERALSPNACSAADPKRVQRRRNRQMHPTATASSAARSRTRRTQRVVRARARRCGRIGLALVPGVHQGRIQARGAAAERTRGRTRPDVVDRDLTAAAVGARRRHAPAHGWCVVCTWPRRRDGRQHERRTARHAHARTRRGHRGRAVERRGWLVQHIVRHFPLMTTSVKDAARRVRARDG